MARSTRIVRTVGDTSIVDIHTYGKGASSHQFVIQDGTVIRPGLYRTQQEAEAVLGWPPLPAPVVIPLSIPQIASLVTSQPTPIPVPQVQPIPVGPPASAGMVVAPRKRSKAVWIAAAVAVPAAAMLLYYLLKRK